MRIQGEPGEGSRRYAQTPRLEGLTSRMLKEDMLDSIASMLIGDAMTGLL
jgi:hypothetical protein